jgi:hypothetical protein
MSKEVLFFKRGVCMLDIIYPKIRLASVRQLVEFYPPFTQSSIRWLIFNESQNGFSVCVRRIGRKVLIDLDEFEGWVNAQKLSPGKLGKSY